MKWNKIDLDGNNIILEDINSKKISINKSDDDKIKRIANKHKDSVDEILNLLKEKNNSKLQQFAEKLYNIHTINTGNFENAIIRECIINSDNVEFKIDIKEISVELFNAQNNPLYILVVCETNGFMAKQMQIEKNINISEYYGFGLECWRPYKGESDIVKLLEDFKKKTGYSLHICFLGAGNWQNQLKEKENILRKWKNLKKRFVLIVDIFSLCNELNEKVANIFDDNDVGGCLIPIDLKNHKKSAIKYYKKHKQNTFNHLYGNINQYHENINEIATGGCFGLMHIELEIASVANLFRRLHFIAGQKFNLKRSLNANKLDKVVETL